MKIKTIFIVIIVFLAAGREIKSQSVFKTVESGFYGVVAPSFVEGVNCYGGNPANLNFDEKEIGVQFVSWIGDMYQVTGQYAMPAFSNDKVKVESSVNVGYLYSGEIELRDSNASLLDSVNYGQSLISLVNSIDLKSIIVGISFNYLTADFNDVYDSNMTFDFGVNYAFEFSDNIEFILGAAINNIMADNNNYITPKHVDNSLGLIYYSDEDESVMGIGMGYMSVREMNKIGISGFYENYVGFSDKMKFKLRIVGSYGGYVGESISLIKVDDTDIISRLKLGLIFDFGLFKIVYGYSNLGIAGSINNVAVNFNI